MGLKVFLGLCLAWFCGLCSAQTLAELEWVVVGSAGQVARISFNANVRFLRQAPMGDSDLLQVTFDIVGNDDSILGQTVEEGRRLPPAPQRPGIALTYVPQPAVRAKNLILRFTSKARVLARQGPNAKTIDLVFARSDAQSALPPMPEAPQDRRYALLLQTLPTGGNAALPRIPVDFQDYAVFTQPVDDGGAKRNALALGYFRSSEDAETVRRRALALFPDARVIDLFVAAAPTPIPAPALAPVAAAMPLTPPGPATQFGVLLKAFAPNDMGAMPRVPVEFQDYAVFTRPMEEGAGQQIALVIGYFPTAREADAVRQRAAARFPNAKVIDLTPPAVAAVPVRATEPVKIAVAPVPSPALAPVQQAQPTPGPVAVPGTKPLPPPTPTALPETATAGGPAVSPVTSAEVTNKAASLLATARQAFAAQRYQDTVDVLNQALMLPPNASSQEAQELIGFAWEGLQQPSKALIEYKLYMKLYPQSSAANKVAQRVEALTTNATASTPPTSESDKDTKSRLAYSGSISQYYYGGQTKTESLVNIAAGIDQNTLSRTNQSSLVTSVDMSGRYKTDESEYKLVLRDTSAMNFITTGNSQSVLSAAYIDYRDTGSRMGLRVGRQSAIGGSLFGLFDGVSLTMPVANQYKVSATLGVPANQLVSAPAQRMAGVMVEADSLFEHWGGNISLVDQTTEGISDRRAIGLEVRYFGDDVSVFSQLDYDINFGVLNAATLQGSFQGPFGTTVTLLLDDRKAPSLQLSDALISSGATSLQTLLQLKSLSEVQGLALDTTARAKQAMLSLSKALSDKWQGSVDFRYSDVGALPAVGNFQAMPATGAQYNVSMQLTGSNLYSSRDINGFNVSYLSSDTLHGTQMAYNNLTGFWDNKASFEPSIRLYTQTDNTATKVVRVSPGLRLSYKLSERASLLAETIYEWSQTQGPTSHDDSSSYFFYLGYRYDFFK